ncbi:MAG: hypothetical protein MZV63_31825 [Marinilabiliales bacterium]|nr:hypothetical protein [Marinilabiliales bacterium]
MRFQLLADVVIPAGALQATGVVENSKTYVQLFDSRGLADLDIILDHTPYLDASVSGLRGQRRLRREGEPARLGTERPPLRRTGRPERPSHGALRQRRERRACRPAR